VEDQESLESSAVVSNLPYPVQDKVNYFLPHGVLPPGVLVGSVLHTADHLLEQLTVGAGSDLIYRGGLQVNDDSPGDLLASSSLKEEGGVGVVCLTGQLVRRHGAIRLKTSRQ